LRLFSVLPFLTNALPGVRIQTKFSNSQRAPLRNVLWEPALIKINKKGVKMVLPDGKQNADMQI
jgi:hypothetical protein